MSIYFIFIAVYLFSAFLFWRYVSLSHGKNGVWSNVAPNTWDVILVFIPLVNTCLNLVWLLRWPLKRKFKYGDYSKFFNIKTLLLFLTFCAVSCAIEPELIKPIEKYYGKGYILAKEPLFFNNGSVLTLKNSDTIIEVCVLRFDAENLKVGDTIKPKNK